MKMTLLSKFWQKRRPDDVRTSVAKRSRKLSREADAAEVTAEFQVNRFFVSYGVQSWIREVWTWNQCYRDAGELFAYLFHHWPGNVVLYRPFLGLWRPALLLNRAWP
jgi:hypothetical protein